MFMFSVIYVVSDFEPTWPIDHFSDMNALMAGENFAQHGFVKLRFLPVHYVGGVWEHSDFYTHYPPLADIVNGLMRKMGVDSLSSMRIFCGLLFIGGMVFTYMAFIPALGAMASLIGMVFGATTVMFVGYCVSIYQHTYLVLFMGAFLWLFLKAVDDEKPFRGIWWACWGVLFLDSLTSFEYLLYPQIIAWVYVLATGRLKKHWKHLVFLGTALLLGFVLHILQNIWALGWEKFASDAMGFHNYTTQQGRTRFTMWAAVPQNIWRHTQRLFSMPWPVLLALTAGLVTYQSRQNQENPTRFRRLCSLALALAVAPLGWYMFMPGHTDNHAHVATQLYLLLIFTMGGIGEMLVNWLVRRESQLVLRAGAALALVIMCYTQYQSFGMLSMHGGLESAMMFEAIGGDAVPGNSAVLHNCAAEAQFSYFIRRPSWRSPNWATDRFPEVLPEIQKRLAPGWAPGYYLYWGRGASSLYADSRDAGLLELLASRCEGKYLEWPKNKYYDGYVILFDIRPLLPDYAGPKPSAEVLQRQLQGSFSQWQLPGFEKRAWDVIERSLAE